MPSSHSKDLEIHNAKMFKTSVAQNVTNLYMTIGKTSPWPSDTNPPVPTTSVSSIVDIYKNMLGGKKVTGNDIRHCIPRYNWTPNEIWNQYEDFWDSSALTAANNKFYVVTDDFHVYKCLSNNYGGISTVKPAGTPTSLPFTTSDKYVWKYMYSISAEEQTQFTTANFIPVKTLTIADGSTQWSVQTNTIEGTISNIRVVTRGANYTSSNINVRIIGDGFNANAFAVRNTTANNISEIVIDDPGYGYSRASVVISGGGGQGAFARAVIPPPGGHGSDPVTELGGSYLIISVKLAASENNKLTVANDFRQVAIIADPTKRLSTTPFTNTTFSQVTTVSVSGVSVNYEKDEFVYQGLSFTASSFRGIVSDWDGFNTLRLYGIEGLPTNDRLIGYSSAAVRQLITVTQQPELETNSGKLLYIDNIEPVQRDPNQTENFKIVLSF
jgi:hypothetical protein